VLVALDDLSFFETAVEGASFGLVTALRALPSLAGLALLRDGESGDFMVVYARGPRSHDIVRARVPADDAVVGLAVVRGGPVLVEYGSDRSPPSRHAGFGDPWTAMVIPLVLDDRCVGVLELVDPVEGRTPDEAMRQVLATIGRRIASFLEGRPLVVRTAFAPEQVGLDD
jgi:GAF domain-containing protein